MTTGDNISSALKVQKLSIIPDYESQHIWESYPEQLGTEYRQSTDEGLDISGYEELFKAVKAMPRSKHKEKMADVLYDIVMSANVAENYPYIEPSDLEGICQCFDKNLPSPILPDRAALREKISGAWYGRICGCLLGKPIEGIRTDELIPLLKQSGNYPLTRYIEKLDITEDLIKKTRFPLTNRTYADVVSCAPADDDTNYTVLYQELITKYGRDFTPRNVSSFWMAMQPKNAYCTAERVAFCNFVKGFTPPVSAIYKNPYRELIGAQIRADYFGYINPGNPKEAARMAWKDASVSHIKNGIYGEMFIAALIAITAVEKDLYRAIKTAMKYIPQKSRLFEHLSMVIRDYDSNVSAGDCFKNIHSRWNEHDTHDWCHTISNAEIVIAAILYGNGDFSKSICMAVQAGFDTDCNGATVGSVIGINKGITAIEKKWLEPLRGKLETQLFGVGTVNIEDRINITLEHINSYLDSINQS